MSSQCGSIDWNHISDTKKRTINKYPIFRNYLIDNSGNLYTVSIARKFLAKHFEIQGFLFTFDTICPLNLDHKRR